MSGPDVVPFAVFGAAIILAAAGGFCVGYLMQSNKVLKWRVRWIIHEHKLARLQERDPVDIDAFDKQSED